MFDVKELFTKLINVTKDGRITWKVIPGYLNETKNEPLSKYILKNKKKFYSTYGHDNLDEYSSYCADFNSDGLFLLLSYSDDKSKYFILCAQNSKDSRIVEINVRQEFQSDAMVLVTCIRNSMDNIDGMVEKMISF